jgi:two-component system, OmpR family, alkaline phosphatase synthesis response regulator PhoP
MKHILIIEDDADICELTKIWLEKKGFYVDTVGSSEEAFAKIEFDKPDLILLDVILPGINGLELLKILKNNFKTNSIKIILFTALSINVQNRLGLDEKANGYLGKPFTNKELYEMVDKILIQ